jgi:hypothetical protein
VKAVFVELPPFAFLRLQRLLMLNPEAGALIPGTGGMSGRQGGDNEEID